MADRRARRSCSDAGGGTAEPRRCRPAWEGALAHRSSALRPVEAVHWCPTNKADLPLRITHRLPARPTTREQQDTGPHPARLTAVRALIDGNLTMEYAFSGLLDVDTRIPANRNYTNLKRVVMVG